MKIKGEIEIRDSNGKIVKKQKMNSWVKGFLQILRAFFNASADSITNTSNSSFNILVSSASYAVRFELNSASGTTSYGIVVGTSDSSVSIADIALGSLIAHGSGANQLSYGATSVGTVSILTNSATFTVARTLTNNSGSAITIKEVGLYARVTASAGSSNYVCIERSLLELEIPNDENYTITYTLTISV